MNDNTDLTTTATEEPEYEAAPAPQPLAPAEAETPPAESPQMAAPEPTAPEPPPPAALPQKEPAPASEADEADFKRQYWRSVLTGNPATVPAAVRKQAGVDELDAPAEQKEYRLLSTINRSWAADHLPHSREKVRADWSQQRARLADKLHVRNNEQEVFLALSQEAEDEPRREVARRITGECYLAGLEGRSLQLPEDALSGLSAEDARHAHTLAEATFAHGQSRREELSGLAERIASGIDAFAAYEETVFPAPRIAAALPDLLQAVDQLADLDENSRNTALYLAAGMARQSRAGQDNPGLLERVVQSIRRGTGDLGSGMLQGVSNVGIAMLNNIGRLLDNEGVSRTAEAWDKRMQMLDSLRRLSQEELRPLVLPGEEDEAASYLITAAEQVPAALLSCCGGAGFSALTLGAVGNSVAAARARAPLADQELQLYAGLLAGTIQAGIYMNLNRVGGRLLEQSISGLSRASGRGLAGYTLAGLNVMSGMTTEAAKLLAAGKLAGAADLGAQELAARLSRTASNINWQTYGDNLTDIEANMHEAAGLLPFLLLGSGRLGLQHFRSPRAILGEGLALERLGVPAEQVEQIMRESRPGEQSELLHEALSGCRLFSGLWEGPDAQRALGLLHTDGYRNFFGVDQVRDFLKLPPEDPVAAAKPELEKAAEAEDPQSAGSRRVEALRLWNEWRELSPLGKSDRGLRIVPRDEKRGTANLPIAQQEAQWQRAQANVYLSLPEREKQIRTCAEDIVRHSYLFLMNVYSVDAVQDSKRDVKVWKNSANMARRKLLGEVVKAVAAICDGRPRERSLVGLNRFMSSFSTSNKKDKYHRSSQRNQNGNFIARIINRMEKVSSHYWSRSYPEAQEALDVVRTMHRGVNMLADLAPQMPDFQTALTRGQSPGRAVTGYLCRILGLLRSDADIRGQEHTLNTTPMKEYSARNAARFDTYRRLTGFDLEKAKAPDGHTYVRGRRVDGSYTHWHETAEQAINDIAGNAALEYTDLGKPVYSPEMLSRGSEINLMNMPERLSEDSYTKADQTCSMALSELGSLWHGTATSLLPGFTIRDNVRSFTIRPGHEASLAPLAANGTNFQAVQSFINSPISLAQARFETVVRRYIMSGHVHPQELVECLENRCYETPERLEELRKKITDHFEFTTSGKAYKIRRQADKGAERVLDEVVQTTTQYAMDYFLGMQNKLGYPKVIKTWLATQAFHPNIRYADTHGINREPNDAEVTRRANLASAAYLQERLDSIGRVRVAERDLVKKEDILSELLEDMIGLTGTRNYEQGWCHYTGGERGAVAVYSAPQYYWNMLRSPLRALKYMTPRQATSVRRHIEKLCSEVNFFSEHNTGASVVDYAVTYLDNMLRKYPEMHRYSASRVDEGRLYRMELRGEDHPALSADTERTPLPLYKRDRIRRGYELRKVAKMPDFITQDPGGQASMLLLDHLRSYVVHRPMADSSGIWWKNELYGQFGKSPAGLENAYVSVHPILPLLDKLREAGAQSAAGTPITVCGIPLTGVDPALKIGPISQATTYRMQGDDSRVYRLMPGDPMLDGTPLRSPYVVQCERGAYIGQRGVVREDDDMSRVCIPLQLFTPYEHRITTEVSRGTPVQRAYYDTLNSLMAIPWDPAIPMAHRSAYVLEYLLRLGEDSGFSQVMARKELSECLPEEAALLNLLGDLVTTVCAEDPTPAMARLDQTAKRYRKYEDALMARIVKYLSRLSHPELPAEEKSADE